MTVLTKQRMVLFLSPGSVRSMPLFRAESGHFKRHPLEVPRGAWEDMGSPLKITVTIEPGDKLNG